MLNRNGLLEQFANSFLVAASGADPHSLLHVDSLVPANLLASGYTRGRHQGFSTQTKMVVETTGEIVVQKSALSPAQRPKTLDVEQIDCTEAYQTGPQLDHLIVDALTRKGVDAAIVQLRRWIDFLIDNGLEVQDKTDVYNSTLKPEYFDCNPRNLIVTRSGLKPIDLEWRYLKPLTLRTALLLYLKPFTSLEATVLQRHLKGRAPLQIQLLRLLGVDFTRQQFRDSSDQRRRINRLITAERSTDRPGRIDAEKRPSIFRRARDLLAAAS